MDRSLFFCLVLVSFIGTVLTLDEQMLEMMKMLRQDCIQETGVDVGLLQKIDGGADLMPDPKLMCYCKCIMENAGMLSDGEVDVDVVVELLPEEMRAHNEDALRKCGTQKGKDDCETSYLTQVCWQNANKKASKEFRGYL